MLIFLCFEIAHSVLMRVSENFGVRIVDFMLIFL